MWLTLYSPHQKPQAVAASAEELTATSLQAATASEEIATTIEEIAKGLGSMQKILKYQLII